MTVNVDILISKSIPSKFLLICLFFIVEFRTSFGKDINVHLGTNDTSEYDYFDYESSNFDNVTVIPFEEGPREETKNFTFRKCFCDIQEVWREGKCVTKGTDVVIPLLKDLYPESDILLHFIFSTVNIQNVNRSKTNFSVELREDGLFILGNGELYSEESDMIFSLNSYCFEFIEEENIIKTIARVNVSPPKVPICSSNEDASDSITSVPLNISFGSNFASLEDVEVKKVEKPKCKDKDHELILPLTNDKEELSFHFISGNIELLWQPPFPARVPKVFSSNEYCVLNHLEDPSTYAINLCYDDPVIRHRKQCDKSVCVRKCCPHHHIYDSMLKKCSPYERATNSSFPPPFYDFQSKSFVAAPDNLLIENFFPWCSPQQLYIIDPKSNQADEFFLLNNGSLYISFSKLTMPPSLYCLDAFLQDDVMTIKALSCFLKEVEDKDYCKDVHRILYPILIVISCAFLAITLTVYTVIPELHAKLHGKSLLSHVSSLLIAFLCQLIVSWSSKNLSMMGCKFIALGNQVSFLWAFFWLNVMCFDIWWTLKSLSLIPETGESSRKRFALYSMYAWGCPIIISFFTAVMEFLPSSVDKSGLILPGFGVRGCWFQDTKSTWLYFHGFTLFLYVSNIFFFFHVAAILINAQRSTEGILRTTRKQHKERVYLYLKLFVVMGITWICEVASWQEGTCEYWIFTDIINSLQGVMIFFIFMCNKKVFQKIQSKGVPIFRRMKALVRAPSSTECGVARGNSSSQRMTQTSDESSSRRLSSSVPPIDSQLIKKI